MDIFKKRLQINCIEDSQLTWLAPNFSTTYLGGINYESLFHLYLLNEFLKKKKITAPWKFQKIRMLLRLVY